MMGPRLCPGPRGEVVEMRAITLPSDECASSLRDLLFIPDPVYLVATICAD